ncbi:MAG: metal ABC transporter ATP-binding protein [Polyangia bacterium]|nr:metal ABC transporter ATP-binding protein [Polyangia bacterium]
MPVIELREASIGFPGAWTLGPIDLEVEQGSFWGIVGPNGSGKSTLLRSIAGLLPFVSGECKLRGGAERRGGIAYVPQRDTLDPVFPVTALAVVMMGLAPSLGFGRPFGPGHRKQAMTALERVGLPHLAQTPFRQLSGGEQQRTLIARASVASSRVMLLDEPTAAMDVDAERDVLALIEDMTRTEKIAVMVVSHSLTTVRAHAERAILVNRDLGLAKVGSPEDVLGAGDPCVHESFRGVRHRRDAQAGAPPECLDPDVQGGPDEEGPGNGPGDHGSDPSHLDHKRASDERDSTGSGDQEGSKP